MLLVTSLSVWAGSQVPIKAHWHSDLQFDIQLPIVSVSGAGEGGGLHLGRLAVASIWEEVNLATGEGLAFYRLIAANLDEIYITFEFLAIPVGPGQFHIAGTWIATGGTGRWNGASGGGIYEGDAAFTGDTTGIGDFAMTGTISSPGSLKK
jgi:hypothetical protein